MSDHHYESVYTTSRQTIPLSDVSSAWKIAAACFAALQLVGYMILAIVVGYPSQELQFNTTASIFCAFFLIGASCCGLVWIACVEWKQKHFIIHALFIPYSTFNILALINILLHIHGRDLRLNALRIVGICLPTVFSVCYGLAALLIYREYRRRRAESSMPLLSDEEMQRRQLLRLLKEQSQNAPSPELVRNTYRFDLPDNEAGRNNWNPLASS